MYALSIRAHFQDDILNEAFKKLEDNGLLGTIKQKSLVPEYQ